MRHPLKVCQHGVDRPLLYSLRIPVCRQSLNPPTLGLAIFLKSRQHGLICSLGKGQIHNGFPSHPSLFLAMSQRGTVLVPQETYRLLILVGLSVIVLERDGEMLNVIPGVLIERGLVPHEREIASVHRHGPTCCLATH